MSHEVCAACGAEVVCGSCTQPDCPGRLGDQRDRLPGELRCFRVGAFVEFDVWAEDAGQADHIVSRLGIPTELRRRAWGDQSLTMEGVIGGQRVTAEARSIYCLSVYENPEEP